MLPYTAVDLLNAMDIAPAREGDRRHGSTPSAGPLPSLAPAIASAYRRRRRSAAPPDSASAS